MEPRVFLFLALMLASFVLIHADAGATALNVSDKPEHTQFAEMARWLVHKNNWGVLATISKELGGVPFGDAEGYSDGAPGQATGRILFFLPDVGSAAINIKANSSATFMISEAELPGGCAGVDPEDPRCARVALVGNVALVPEHELQEAKEMLFSRHPVYRSWHAHPFRVYELHITAVRVLDWFGGYGWVKPEEYYAAQPVQQPAAKPTLSTQA